VAMRLVQIAMNARDNSALGRFWAEALGWKVIGDESGETNVEPEGFAYPDPIAVCIDIIAVPERKRVKNRVHVDLATNSAAHQADLVARLQTLGATPANVGQAMSRGRSWPTRRATSSACWSLDRSTGTPGRWPRWRSTARIRGPWPGSGARRWTGPCTR
jgi:hypothetical protein